MLRLQAPVKIFGDLHGQYEDLMALFDVYGAPSEQGDLCATDYLFTGDFVDRGRHQLETVALLLALKARDACSVWQPVLPGAQGCGVTRAPAAAAAPRR